MTLIMPADAPNRGGTTEWLLSDPTSLSTGHIALRDVCWLLASSFSLVNKGSGGLTKLCRGYKRLRSFFIPFLTSSGGFFVCCVHFSSSERGHYGNGTFLLITASSLEFLPFSTDFCFRGAACHKVWGQSGVDRWNSSAILLSEAQTHRALRLR